METQVKAKEIPQDIQDLLSKVLISWDPEDALLWFPDITRGSGYVSFFLQINPDKSLSPRLGRTERPTLVNFHAFSDGVVSLMIILKEEGN